MNNLVKVYDNKDYGLITTSRIVAEGLGKQHKNVLRDLDKILENPNLGSLIIPTTYKVEGQKREYKEYLLTKDGFTLYMFNIQGYNDFKMAYIKRFNEMENIIKSKQIPKDRSKYEITNKTYKHIPVMTVRDISHITDISTYNINYIIRTKGLGRLLSGRELSDFRVENKGFENVQRDMNILYKEDVKKILEEFKTLTADKQKLLNKYFGEDKKALAIKNNFDYDKLVRVMNLSNLMIMNNRFSPKELRKKIDRLISEEFVSLGLLEKPCDDLNINSAEGWALVNNLNDFYRNYRR